MRKFVVIIICLLLALPMIASRPKVGLVLSGGGAKGAAEIGVLKVIDKARKDGLHIDYIAGTSIGALIGGLYAVGFTPDEIEQMFLNEEWLTLFSKDAVGIFAKNSWRAPTGLVRSNVIQEKLDSIFSKVHRRFFSDTLIPFSCIAVDVNKIKEEKLNAGVLAREILASMAYPGFLPVRQDGKLLVDGGILNNLPVDVVREMGADIVIAVDLEQETPQRRRFSLNGLLGIGGVANWISSRPDIKKHELNVLDADIYIQPPLKGYSIKDFETYKLKKMVDIGETAGRNCWQQLMKLKYKQ